MWEVLDKALEIKGACSKIFGEIFYYSKNKFILGSSSQKSNFPNVAEKLQGHLNFRVQNQVAVNFEAFFGRTIVPQAISLNSYLENSGFHRAYFKDMNTLMEDRYTDILLDGIDLP